MIKLPLELRKYEGGTSGRMYAILTDQRGEEIIETGNPADIDKLDMMVDVVNELNFRMEGLLK